MPTGHGTHRRSRFLLLRLLRARPRLFFCGALGIVVVLALTVLTGWRLSTRLLLGWNIAVGLYMVLASS